MSFLYNWWYGPVNDTTFAPPYQITPAQAFAYVSDADALLEAKMNLRPTKTREYPSTYESRIPHIAEMHRLIRAYRREQESYTEEVEIEVDVDDE